MAEKFRTSQCHSGGIRVTLWSVMFELFRQGTACSQRTSQRASLRSRSSDLICHGMGRSPTLLHSRQGRVGSRGEVPILFVGRPDMPGARFWQRVLVLAHAMFDIVCVQESECCRRLSRQLGCTSVIHQGTLGMKEHDAFQIPV